MKLLHVAVEGCGRFGTPARIEGLGPGVNILAAGNEAGKSTLFRAIRTCLFERHGSTSREIAALATQGLSLPVTITVGFEQDGRAYEITKSFLKSKSATLTCDGVVTARNSEADEKVWEILGVSHKSARALDEAAYGVLWVRQGQSADAPEPSEGATGVLNEVIAQEVGTLVGGERARSVLAVLREELSRLVTDTRRPRANGPLDLAQKECDSIAAGLAGAEARYRELNERYTALEQLRAELKRAADPAEAGKELRERDETRGRLDVAEKAVQALLQLRTEERLAHEQVTSQRTQHDGLLMRAAAIAGNRARLERARADVLALDTREAEARAALSTAKMEKDALDRTADELDAREREIGRLSDLAARLSGREAMAARLGQLNDFHSRAAANAADLKAATVDGAALRALEEIEQEEENLRARIESAAARLTIEAGPGAGVTLNGDAVTGRAARAVTEAFTVRVGGDVTVTVSPPAATLAAAEERLEQLRHRLKALLASHHLRTAAELRQHRNVRIALEDAARELRAEHSVLAPRGSAAAEIGTLEQAIAGIDAEARSVLPAGAVLPPAAERERQKQEIVQQRQALRAERTRLETLISGQSATLEAIAKERGTQEGQLREINAKLEADLALLPDDAREDRIARAAGELERREAAHRGKAALFEEKRGQAPPADEIERLRNRAERLDGAVRNRAELIDRLQQKIARLEGEIETAGGDGLGERVSALAAQQAVARAELLRQEERVEVLSLLRDTVDRCYARRREELNAPLGRHLRPFLNDVFPESELLLGEDFAIAGLNRPQPGTEGFGGLSLGTQEQVAVLVRLAMGAMIAERGRPVPVILDDALMFSDDARIERMFDAINRAGRNQQVIVLTCRARSFASLGGRQLRIV